MAIQEVQPTIQALVIKEFLQKWISYIQKNPIKVADLEVTSDQLKAKPFLLAPCFIGFANLCPDQKYQLPNCHRCPHAKATTKLIEVAANKSNISTEIPQPNHGTGSISQIIRHNVSQDYAVYKQDGDDNGDGTIFLAQTRRPLESS